MPGGLTRNLGARTGLGVVVVIHPGLLLVGGFGLVPVASSGASSLATHNLRMPVPRTTCACRTRQDHTSIQKRLVPVASFRARGVAPHSMCLHNKAGSNIS